MNFFRHVFLVEYSGETTVDDHEYYPGTSDSDVAVENLSQFFKRAGGANALVDYLEENIGGKAARRTYVATWCIRGGIMSIEDWSFPLSSFETARENKEAPSVH